MFIYCACVRCVLYVTTSAMSWSLVQSSPMECACLILCGQGVFRHGKQKAGGGGGDQAHSPRYFNFISNVRHSINFVQTCQFKSINQSIH
jgi:hypothetical protein